MTCYNYLSLSSLKKKETSSENGMYSNKLTQATNRTAVPLAGKETKGATLPDCLILPSVNKIFFVFKNNLSV